MRRLTMKDHIQGSDYVLKFVLERNFSEYEKHIIEVIVDII